MWSSGTYSKWNQATGGWSGDQSSGIGIEAGRHDTQDNDFATGINNCLTKDGQNTPTANLPMGGRKHTGVADATAATDYLAYGQIRNGAPVYLDPANNRLGVGTATPGHLLSVYQTTSTTAHCQLQGLQTASGGSGKAALHIDVNGQGGFTVQVDGTSGSRVLQVISANGYNSSPTTIFNSDASGNVGFYCPPDAAARVKARGVSTTSSNSALVIQDSAGADMLNIRNDGLVNTGTRASSPYNLTTASGANVFVDANGSLFRSTSSVRYKTDIEDSQHGLAQVLALRPVTYRGTNDGDTVFGGLIAEEVHAAGLSEFVVYDANNEPDALNYGNMVSLAFKAIQELNAKVEALEAQLAAG